MEHDQSARAQQPSRRPGCRPNGQRAGMRQPAIAEHQDGQNPDGRSRTSGDRSFGSLASGRRTWSRRHSYAGIRRSRSSSLLKIVRSRWALKARRGSMSSTIMAVPRNRHARYVNLILIGSHGPPICKPQNWARLTGSSSHIRARTITRRFARCGSDLRRPKVGPFSRLPQRSCSPGRLSSRVSRSRRTRRCKASPGSCSLSLWPGRLGSLRSSRRIPSRLP